MKKGLCFFLLCWAITLAAQVSVLSVSDEDKHSKPEDFYHTFEYYITSPGAKNAKCQATRLAPRWFATAAHCVSELCKNTCTLHIDLLDTPISVLAETTHTAKKPTVFVHPGFSETQLVKDDFALIYADIRRAPKMYYQRRGDKNVVISSAAFAAWMEKNLSAKSKYNHALSPVLPPIAVFDNERNYLLDRTVSVISIFDGQREVKQNPHAVYYVKDLQYAYTQNFGIRKGMSGSGVMTNTGELIGIISAYIGADLYQGKQKVKHEDLFVFPVFNASLVQFIKEVMGSDFARVERKEAFPGLVRKTRRDFSALVQGLNPPKNGKNR